MNEENGMDARIATLTGVFLVTLWFVYQVENVFLWLLWAVIMVVLSGTALIYYNQTE